MDDSSSYDRDDPYRIFKELWFVISTCMLVYDDITGASEEADKEGEKKRR